jgi:predicted permease
VALAFAGLRLLVALGPANLPRLDEIGIDGRALAFTLVLSSASGVLFGLLPALKYTGSRLAAGLGGSTRTSTAGRERYRARNTLVVAQVALALVLLVSAGLLIRTFRALRLVEPGFTGAQQVQTARISIPESLVPEAERVARLQNEIADRLLALPGVTAVGFASAMHMEALPANWDLIEPEDAPNDGGAQKPPLRIFKDVSPGLFRATGTRVVAGREYAWEDLYGRRPVLIVSENLAREVWGGPSAALGRRIRTLPGAPWREIVGVVEDVRDNGPNEPAPSIVYWPSLGAGRYREGSTGVARNVTFAIRSPRAGSRALVDEVRRAVWAVDPNVPVASVRTLQEAHDRSMERTSFTLVMLAIAAAMALLLGLVGIYGVISYAVAQRTREIGIRLALGAAPREVKTMFVRHGLALAGAGAAIGLAAAAGLARLISSLLFGVSPTDPVTYALVPLVLIAAATVASYVAARRAAVVDPVEALKAE